MLICVIHTKENSIDRPSLINTGECISYNNKISYMTVKIGNMRLTFLGRRPCHHGMVLRPCSALHMIRASVRQQDKRYSCTRCMRDRTSPGLLPYNHIVISLNEDNSTNFGLSLLQFVTLLVGHILCWTSRITTRKAPYHYGCK